MGYGPHSDLDFMFGFPRRRDFSDNLGVVVADVCKSPKWDECWCDKEGQTGGCRWCQTYQLFWGLDPTCGDKGVPEKEYWSRGYRHERTDEELQKLLDLQKLLREKYRK